MLRLFAVVQEEREKRRWLLENTGRGGSGGHDKACALNYNFSHALVSAITNVDQRKQLLVTEFITQLTVSSTLHRAEGDFQRTVRRKQQTKRSNWWPILRMNCKLLLGVVGVYEGVVVGMLSLGEEGCLVVTLHFPDAANGWHRLATDTCRCIFPLERRKNLA